MIVLPIPFHGNVYHFNRFLGWVTCEKNPAGLVPQRQTNLTPLQEASYNAVCKPFTLSNRPPCSALEPIPSWHRWYIALLMWAARYCFLLLRILMKLRLKTYSDAGQAAEAFRRYLPDEKKQKELCLSRAVYITTTSRRFDEYGTLFIGIHLPLVRMHAWVIEDNMHADCLDREWTAYQPIAIY